ncbi:Periplasmic serine endoprotease DegP [subsurface metagenome]
MKHDLEENMIIKRSSLIVFMIIIFALFTISCRQAHPTGQQETSPPEDAQAQPLSPPPTLEQIQTSFRQVAQSVLPVVVEIDVVEVISQRVPRAQSPWDFFFDPSPGDDDTPEREFRRPGLGSGVIVRKQGNKVYVLSNNHVVGEADEISIRLYDERQFKGKLVGTDPRRDLALVVFETREEVPVARLGNSNELQVGDLVLAVGNPFGFESTVTSGIISALGRKADAALTVANFTDYIQTDAAINPGNSGGALVNLRGEVIGINTWIASRTGSYMGLGFAVPINNAKKAIDDFITKGKVEYGWLGVQIGDLNPEIYPEIRENLKLSHRNGAFVFNIFKGSPAYKAGIRPGDYITRVNQENIENADHLTKVVGNLPPGNETRFEIIRRGSPLTLSTKISIREEEKEIAAQSKNLWPGMYISHITGEIRDQLELARDIRGVVIRFVVEGTPAAVAGFKQGDIVQKINEVEIRSARDFYQALNDTGSRELMMRLYREQSEILLGLVK